MARTRYTKTALPKWLDTVREPVYVVDDRRRILYMNAACAEWIGLDPDELIGQECRYHSSGGVGETSSAAAALCPPPDSGQGRRVTGRIGWPFTGSQAAFRRAEFVPLYGADDEPAGVIVFVAAGEETVEETVTSKDELDPAQLHEQLIRFRGQLRDRFQLERFVGASPAMTQVRAQAMLAATSLATVVVMGPRGSGRRELARAIHFSSSATSDGALVPVDCAVATGESIQAAIASLTGRPLSALERPPGTLVLEDVHETPGELQSELLGRLKEIAPAHRIVATAHEPLAHLVEQDRLPSELATFLSTLVIQLPSLLDRLEDLPLVVQSIIEEANQTADRQIGGALSITMDQLAIYPWTGDVSELREVVLAACKTAEATEIQLRDLPRRVRMATDATKFPAREPERIVLDEFLGEIETELITRALAEAKGNKTLAAKLLGMNRPRLYRRMVQLEFEDVLPDFQPDDGRDTGLDRDTTAL